MIHPGVVSVDPNLALDLDRLSSYTAFADAQAA
jgi:hypothetical protein